ncbi:unnamed protein product, partial [Polarella glacialis]
AVKMEELEQAPTSLHMCDSADTLAHFQRTLLSGIAGFPSMMDPSRCADAERRWGHLIELFEPTDLLQGHHEISPLFSNGTHKGWSVEGLPCDLQQGRVLAGELPPLVAARLKGEVYVVCGNRRLWALLECARRACRHSLKVPVIVHDHPFYHIHPESLRLRFAFKVIEAVSTRRGGKQASFIRR